jgi:hypothetical protein
VALFDTYTKSEITNRFSSSQRGALIELNTFESNLPQSSTSVSIFIYHRRQHSLDTEIIAK